MSVENWIDVIAKLWEFSDGQGGTVLSYRCYERDEFPEALAKFPCALTYITGWNLVTGISFGGPLKVLYRGVTELHLTDNVSKARLPWMMLFYARIRNALAAHLQLGGLVDDFRFATDRIPIEGPVKLKYGSENEHMGLLINWEVKADETTDAGFIPAI